MKTPLLAALVIVGCSSVAEHEKAWEGIYRDFLLPGYSDFRGEIDGTDDGYIVGSYRLPPGTHFDAAIAAIRATIAVKEPCYQVTAETKDRLTVRCAGGRIRGGFRTDEEFQFLVDGKRGRVFMLVLDDVNRPRYREFLSALEEAANR